MIKSRREFMLTTATAAASLAAPNLACSDDSKNNRHIVTLSFDDGFKKSFIRTAEIYEKYKRSACLNVIATGHKSRWLIFNTHGLDDEGWGPIRATYLDRLLDKLLAIDSVDILPAGRALEKYAGRD